MNDLEKWARDTAPKLTDEEWQALETGDVCKSLERFEPDTGYDDELLYRVQELADGLSDYQRQAIHDGDLVDPFGMTQTPTPLGRAVMRAALRAKGGAS